MYRNVPVPREVTIEPFPEELVPHVQRIFEAHGGRLDMLNMLFTAHFPIGTVKHFIWPALISWRWTVVFPDNYEIVLIELRNGRAALGFNPDEFPQEIQDKYSLLFP